MALGYAISVWALASCNEAGTSAVGPAASDALATDDVSSASGPSASELTADPFLAAIQRQLGYDFDDIQSASDRAKVVAASECFESAGLDLQSSVVRGLVVGVGTTTMLDIALSQIAGEPVPGALPKGIPENVAIECTTASETSPAMNALFELQALLDGFMSEVNDRALGDC